MIIWLYKRVLNNNVSATDSHIYIYSFFAKKLSYYVGNLFYTNKITNTQAHTLVPEISNPLFCKQSDNRCSENKLTSQPTCCFTWLCHLF